MNLLAIDTTGNDELIIVHTDTNDFVQTFSGTKHSEGLLTHVEKVLNKAHLELKDIDVFGNVSGPGSFTGIRIGLATIKAFAYALNKKVVNVSKFDVLGNYYDGYAVLKCTKTSVYWAELGTLNYGVCEISDLPNHINPNSKIVMLDEQIKLGDAYKTIAIALDYCDIVLPYMLAQIDSGNVTTSGNAEPFYIQLSQAERNLGGQND